MNKKPLLVASLAVCLPAMVMSLIFILDPAAHAGNENSLCGAIGDQMGDWRLDPQQLANAVSIIEVARQRGLPARAAVIAIAAAKQESDLIDLAHGDADSVGLFQQRPSQGWGTRAQILDPVYASEQFYQHLVAIRGWRDLPVDTAAQEVQRSATPGAYARWVELATATVARVLGQCLLWGDGSSGGSRGVRVVRAAERWLGTPYAYGGGNANGPTLGHCVGGNGVRGGGCVAAQTIGFDCSGLTLYAYAQVGIRLEHYTGSQWNEGLHVSRGGLRPGDLVFFATDPSDPATIHHVGIYVGNNTMIDAPETGTSVQIEKIWTTQYAGAVRP